MMTCPGCWVSIQSLLVPLVHRNPVIQLVQGHTPNSHKKAHQQSTANLVRGKYETSTPDTQFTIGIPKSTEERLKLYATHRSSVVLHSSLLATVPTLQHLLLLSWPPRLLKLKSQQSQVGGHRAAPWANGIMHKHKQQVLFEISCHQPNSYQRMSKSGGGKEWNLFFNAAEAHHLSLIFWLQQDIWEFAWALHSELW